MPPVRRPLLLALAALAVLLTAPAGAGAEPLHGAHVHPLWNDATPAEDAAELDALVAAGAGTVRVDLGWSTLELAGKGEWDTAYAARLDAFLTAAEARGVETVLVVVGTPCWASSDPDKDCSGAWWEEGVQYWPPTDPADFGDALDYVAQRWGDRLAAVELWNEPNYSAFLQGPDPIDAYAAMVEAAYPRIKARAPDLPVLAGSILFSSTYYLGQLYDRGIAQVSDGIAVHPYDDEERYADPDNEAFKEMFSLAEGLPRLRQVMVDRGDADAKLWVTEFGFPTCARDVFHWCVDEAEQARRIDEGVTRMRAWPWVAAALLYELRDRRAEMVTWQDAMGLVRHDVSPKPAYEAWRDAIARPLPEPEPAPAPAPAREDDIADEQPAAEPPPEDLSQPSADPLPVLPPAPVQTRPRRRSAPGPRVLAVERARRSGVVRVRLACRGSRRCRGRLTVRDRAGRRLGTAVVAVPRRTRAWRRVRLTRRPGAGTRLRVTVTRPAIA